MTTIGRKLVRAADAACDRAGSPVFEITAYLLVSADFAMQPPPGLYGAAQ